jgi:Tat protein secretion system quality control protein TatD with DNase activity
LLIEQAVNSLVDTYKAHPDLVVGFFAELDYTSTKLQTREAQLRRLQATCRAAGEAGLTLQIQVSPGAAGLDETNIKGTPYAQVLLDLQTQLIEMTSTYPNLQIHLSCWSGRADHMISLLKAFPNNLFIGIDGSVSFSKTTQLHECAFDLELPKLVLESSTTIPAVVANALGRDAFFHSATIPYIAQAVAHYKKIPAAAAVGRAASVNTLQMYPQLATSKEEEQEEAGE